MTSGKSRVLPLVALFGASTLATGVTAAEAPIEAEVAAEKALDEAAPAAAESPAPAPAPSVDESTLEYAQQAFDELKSRDQYEEAIPWGKRVLERLGDDPDVVREGNAHLQLAVAYHQQGALENAIDHYDVAVKKYQRGLGRDHEALIKPYWSLARAQGGIGNYGAAVRSYKKTAQLQRVNLGVHTPEQIEPMLELSEVYFEMGDYDRADSVQKAHLKLLARQNPDDPLKVLPAHFSRADMLARMGSSRRALENYNRIIRIVEREKGNNAIEILPALHEMSQVHFWRHMIDVGERDEDPTVGSNTKKQRQDLVSGRSSSSSVSLMVGQEDHLSKAYRILRRAIKIAESNENASEVDKADAHIAMADLLIVKTNDYVSVRRHYVAAWEYLSADDSLQDELDKRFEQRIALNDSPVIRPSGINVMLFREARRGSKPGIVKAKFDITPEGRAKNIEIIESRPAGFKDLTVRNYLQRLVYRPRIVDGELAARVGNQYEIEYVYREDELPSELRHTVSRLH